MLKTRIFKEHNYKGLYLDGRTLRIALDPSKPITELAYPEFYDVKITGYCKGHCPYCFEKNTIIKTTDGDIFIQNIKDGDKVYTYNEKTQTAEINIVSQIYKRQYIGNMIEILLENENIIRVTPNHNIFTKNRGWVEAGNLSENDELLDFAYYDIL